MDYRTPTTETKPKLAIIFNNLSRDQVAHVLNITKDLDHDRTVTLALGETNELLHRI